jgi:lysophospholipase L1-like esterase
MDRTTRIKLFTLIGIVVTLIGIQIISVLREQYTVINFPPHGRTVVAFGDSLTAGVGASSPDRGYVADLSTRLDTPIVNKGVSGDTTEQGLARVAEVTALSPDVVILFLGGNDLLRKVPTADTIANMRTIITTLQQHGAVVIVVSIQGLIGNGLDTEYKALARATGCLFVPDALGGVLGTPSLMSDEIHPNDAGYQRVADRIAPILEGALAFAPAPAPTSE